MGEEKLTEVPKKKASDMKIEMASRWISKICGVEYLAGVSIYALIFQFVSGPARIPS